MCLRMQKGVGSLIWFASPAFGRRDPFGITVAAQSPWLRLTAAGDNAAMEASFSTNYQLVHGAGPAVFVYRPDIVDLDTNCYNQRRLGRHDSFQKRKPNHVQP
jgi:hypothetical protein